MIQTILINKTLVTRRGNTAIQAVHGETIYMDQLLRIENETCSRELTEDEVNMRDTYIQWSSTGMQKVIYKITQDELYDILDTFGKLGIWFNPITDYDVSKVPTGIIIAPIPDEMHKEMFKGFKLL